MTRLRVGVIGVGYLGQFHVEKYAALPDVELVGVVDPNIAHASDIAKKHRTTAYSDPSQLSGRVDAVSIVVPTVFHYEVAQQFLEQGVHVLLEKPITVTLEQADNLIQLAARKKVMLQIGHIERFNPAVTAIKPLIKAPRYVMAERAAPFTIRCTDVNVVLDLMIHDLDIVMDLSGSAPIEVSAAGAAVITREIDVASARIVFRNGCVADITASRVSDEKKRVMRIFEEHVVYTSDYQSQKATVSQSNHESGSAVQARELTGERRDTLADEIRAFVLCAQSGCQPLVSGLEGRRSLSLATIITQCIESKLPGFVPVT